MRPDDKVEQLQERLYALRSLVLQPDNALDREDIEALSAALEQLQLAESELRHQNTELAEARDQLEAERVRYRDLFELAPDASLITDTQGVICEANRATSAMLRMERKFLIGKPLQVFIPAEERQAFRSRVLHATVEQKMEWRLRIQPRDGDPKHVAAAVAPIAEPRCPWAGLRWSLRDVTSVVQDEDRLRDLNVELERRVSARTADLEAANEVKDELLRRERAARDAAEEASRSKDEFLATISHELRTPLNVVLGWTFRLRAHTLEADHVDKVIEIIDRNARQQLHLVEELLDSARIATGRFELDLAPCEFGPIVRSTIEAIEGTAAAKGIRMTCAIQDGIYVRADSLRIRQIAWNLLSNALKFTSENGSVHISLSSERSHAVLSISDSGVGIAAQALPHVFEPFWQAERSTRRARGGLGLGLAIVRHLVELHGGDVDAASKGQEHGATFTVRLPLLLVPLTGDQQPSRREWSGIKSEERFNPEQTD